MKIKQTALIVIIIPFLTLTVDGQSLEQYKTQYNQIQDSEETKRAMLEVNYDTQDELKQQISELDAQLSEATVNLDKIDESMMKVIIKINNAQEEYDDAAKKREEQYERASVRIRYIYENGDTDYLGVLLRSGNISDYLVERQYISDIMEYDSNLLHELEETEKFMKQKLDEITAGEEAKEALENFRTETELKMTVMHEEKNNLLEQYRQDADAMENDLSELVAASDKVYDIITNMEENIDFVNTYTGGKLEWPVEGRYYVSSDYCGRISPVGNGYEFHTGLDIPAPEGYDIEAAEGGVVTSAELIDGYGETIIINHGDGLSTLYGHISKMLVSEGDTVERGQVIALCGATGNATGNHLHFEVRVNGEHINPWEYLERKSE
ncbi:hypothetical protein SDC9_64234 [bioreactor metagenome]|uniref:Uncharacterized protein n=1 Tax=bioreactor metagenome TaxID=1076179 RepID=A0A644XNW8_9ZZZZ|nr:peptidoglycan DD-metalloendopeptidase family protein [Candidatus Metalachnospira sp.]